MIVFGRFLGTNSLTKSLTALCFSYKNPFLKQKIRGITFKNPVGLAAGFDKDLEITGILPSVGFGFAEGGSVTGEPCKGNKKPRLWRLPESRGLVVNYGLKSKGAQSIADKLKKPVFHLPVGISIAKTNAKEFKDNEKAIGDYVKCFQLLHPYANFITINISCPNAFGGQAFTNPDLLDKLLKKIKKIPTKKPVFLKISPDLKKKEIDEIIKIADKYHIDGFVCSNLTKDRTNKKVISRLKDSGIPKKGSISGKAAEELSNLQIEYIYKKTKGKFIIMGCGGVFSAEDAYKKIRLGASLIQLITGMIYEGPQLIGEINQNLVRFLKRDGFKNIAEAVGSDVK